MRSDAEARKARARERYAQDEVQRGLALERARKQRALLTKEDKKRYRTAQRERFRAQGLTLGGKPKKHDAHVAAWRKAQPSRPELHSAHVACWRELCEAAYRRHLYRSRVDVNVRQRLRARLRKLIPDGRLAARFATEAKAGRWPAQWTEQLGYSLADLVKRLAETMPAGYTWHDFLSGALHIDHIKARCTFDCSSPDQLRACWALSNLQLLTARDNLSKGGRSPKSQRVPVGPAEQGNSNPFNRVDSGHCPSFRP